MVSKELSELFKDLPDALENNQNFKYRFSYYPKKSKPLLPHFVDNDKDVNEVLKNKAKQGLKERFEKFIFPRLGNEINKQDVKNYMNLD